MRKTSTPLALRRGEAQQLLTDRNQPGVKAVHKDLKTDFTLFQRRKSKSFHSSGRKASHQFESACQTDEGESRQVRKSRANSSFYQPKINRVDVESETQSNFSPVIRMVQVQSPSTYQFANARSQQSLGQPEQSSRSEYKVEPSLLNIIRQAANNTSPKSSGSRYLDLLQGAQPSPVMNKSQESQTFKGYKIQKIKEDTSDRISVKIDTEDLVLEPTTSSSESLAKPMRQESFRKLKQQALEMYSTIWDHLVAWIRHRTMAEQCECCRQKSQVAEVIHFSLLIIGILDAFFQGFNWRSGLELPISALLAIWPDALSSWIKSPTSLYCQLLLGVLTRKKENPWSLCILALSFLYTRSYKHLKWTSLIFIQIAILAIKTMGSSFFEGALVFCSSLLPFGCLLFLGDGFQAAEVQSNTLRESLEKRKNELKELLNNVAASVLVFSRSSDGSGEFVLKQMNNEFLKTFSVSKEVLAAFLNRRSFQPIFKSPKFDLPDSLSLMRLASLPLSGGAFFLNYSGDRDQCSDKDSIYLSDKDGEMELESNDLQLQVQMMDLTQDDKTLRVITLLDISRALQHQNQKVRFGYQEALTATISHEQMNPLNSIINLTEYLYRQHVDQYQALSQSSKGMVELELSLSGQGGVPSKKVGVENLDDDEGEQAIVISSDTLKQTIQIIQIVHSSSMMMQLLNQAMLNLTLINQGKLSPKMEPVTDPVNVVSNFAKLFNGYMEQKRVQLHIEPRLVGEPALVKDIEQWGLRMDTKLYDQILYNVFLNACKFNQIEGKIHVRLEVKKSDKPLQGKTQVELTTTIEDTGLGIDRKKQRQLFKVFEDIKKSQGEFKDFQDKAKDIKSTSGSGLGLFLSMQLARFFDGDIIIDSTPQVGTKAHIKMCLGLVFSSNGRISSKQTASVPLNNSSVAGLSSSSIVLQQSKQSENVSNSFQLYQKRPSNNSQIVLSSGVLEEDHHTKSWESVVKMNRNSIVMLVPISKVSNTSLVHYQKKPQDILPHPALPQIPHITRRQSQFCPLLASDQILAEELRSISSSSESSGSSSGSSGQTPGSYNLFKLKHKPDSMMPKQQIFEYKDSFQLTAPITTQPPVAVDVTQFATDNTQHQDEDEGVAILSEDSDNQLDLSCLNTAPRNLLVELDQRFEPRSTRSKKSGRNSLVKRPASQMLNNLPSLSASIESLSSSEDVDSQSLSSTQELKAAKRQQVKPGSKPNIDLSIVEEDLVGENLSRYSKMLGLSKNSFVSKTTNKVSSSNQDGSVCELKRASLKGSFSFQPPRLMKTNSVERANEKSGMYSSCEDLLSACKCNRCPILIVDDNIFNLEFLKLTIRSQFGFNPWAANDGLQALNIFTETNINGQGKCSEECKKEPFKLIFMDINMPVMDGFEASQKILSAQQGHQNQCSIVAVTAFSGEEYTKRALSIGMKKVLNKPVTSEMLSEVILQYCPEAKQKGEWSSPKTFNLSKIGRSEKCLSFGPMKMD